MNSNQRPFRFGLQVGGTSEKGMSARKEWSEKAVKAEALGYDILLMADHFGRQRAMAGSRFAIGPALAAAAESTTTLRIGPFVWQNDLRHPALLAMEAATLDVLSNGRFELGLGAGGSFMPDYEWTGIPFDPPGVRVGRLEESIAILKGLFAEDPLIYAGSYYTITEFDGHPKPIQQPHPPILIGGGGPRVLSLAAREANIVSILPTMLPAGGQFKDEEGKTAAVADKVHLVRQAAGDRFPQLELNVLIQADFVTGNQQAGIERLRSERGMSAEVWLDTPYVYIGTTEQIADTLRSYREQLGISYFVVFEPYMDDFAPVVAELAGR